ncbi:MAG: hypothetical protein JJ863_36535 [Deltaproteobacteria bacterium]|nr:hypothetical protein [Deltaproteobacteria bacterium]
MIEWESSPGRAAVFIDVPRDRLPDDLDVREVPGGPMPARLYLAGLPGSAAFADELIDRAADAGIEKLDRATLVVGSVPTGDLGALPGVYLGDVPWSPHHLRRRQHLATKRLLENAREQYVVRITEVGDYEGTVQALRAHHLPFPEVADLLNELPVDLTKGDRSSAERLAKILATHRTSSTVIEPNVPPVVSKGVDAIVAAMESTLLGGGVPLSMIIEGAPDRVWAAPSLAAAAEARDHDQIAEIARSIARDPESCGQTIRGVRSVRVMQSRGVAIVFDLRPYLLLVAGR